MSLIVDDLHIKAEILHPSAYERYALRKANEGSVNLDMRRKLDGPNVLKLSMCKKGKKINEIPSLNCKWKT
jgi:hypothetical protein